MYYAKEINMWPTESGLFDSLEEAKRWGEQNLKGKWSVYKKGLLRDEEVYTYGG
ncbi:hypothetical protein LCX93_10930 [Sulfurimonas sp. SWIR-19]|uniref:hypothetical protein n=1 Tax=Sulfurimonas sp. SWIR-19 TaxID=2878390 RepID=UPI001CF0EFD4|nr:hypothetical protein [Sulfurimonas sp. SWIR-19]UCN00028.1 hypothetical protein LCX93_10930 [Sulfurimonas sp. SWIR-19]